MSNPIVVVRCPRCGSIDAESVEAVGIEFERMKCRACGHWHVLPDERFAELWRALGATGSGRDVFERLRDAYDEPHRAYHTARHIGACLRLLDDPAVRALATRAEEVEAALWFHDAVYDTRAGDNEERSAALAQEALGQGGVAADVADRVARHVRATKDHVAASADEQLVVDVDLSILGADADAFARFEDEIRREYAWVDAERYTLGRASVLGRFLERPSIYGTALLRERFEARARDNVGAALTRLGTRPLAQSRRI